MAKKVDYIIVGDGYAGLFFAHQLIKNKRSFVLFSNGFKGASQVSAGIINPVVLKKFTTFFKAAEQIESLLSSLQEIKDYTHTNFLIDEPIHRIFHDEKERDLWLKKANNEDLKYFLDLDFKKITGINNPFSTGKVNSSYRLDVPSFFHEMLTYLEVNGHLVREAFNYDLLDPESSFYEDYEAKHFVFCEGVAVKTNPFFSDMEIYPNKGHHLKVQLREILLDKVTLKKKHFLFPVQEELYYYGGTYDRDSKDDQIDDAAVQQLVKGLDEIYPNDFELKSVEFGFRPTVKDRRPILGGHPKFNNLFVFNGLGARGILNASYYSPFLYDYIENQVDLPAEVALDRFRS